MTAEQRLKGILSEGRIRGWPPFGGGPPMACFTESTQAGLDHMVGSLGYDTWGVVFRKETLLRAGGGPVWYARQAQWDALGSELRSWAVRTEPDARADWFHEREWRCPAVGNPTSFTFRPQDVHAIIVGRFEWPQGPSDGDGGWIQPSWATGLHRWYWNKTNKELWEMGEFQSPRTLST
jgi:hypothetical protein